MKKFMAVVLVVLLAGCATENPHYKNAQTLVGTVTGAVIGYKTLGGGVLGGLAGAVVAHEVVKGAQWKPGDDEIVYIDPPGYYPQSGYSSCGAVAVYCDTTPKQGMYPPRPGMCNDPDSGSEASYEDLVRRAQRRAGCFNNPSSGYAETQHASYGTQPAVIVSYPPNMWERSDRKQKVEAKKEPYDGPTISDYMSPKWASVIPEDCRTGNYGRDSNCLNSEADTLKGKQDACEADSKKCKPGFNFGQMAWYDRKLAGDLRRAQDKFLGK